MKRAYPKAALLRLRQVALEEAKAKLRERNEVVRSSEELLERARLALAHARGAESAALAKQEKRRAAGSMSISDEVAFEEYGSALRASIVEHEARVKTFEHRHREAEVDVALAKEELTTARAELRVIELHHERFLAEEAKHRERAEEEEQDERATFDAHRRRST